MSHNQVTVADVTHDLHSSIVDNAERKQRLIALDCEMCETARGSELTRMSIVDADGEVKHYW